MTRSHRIFGPTTGTGVPVGPGMVSDMSPRGDSSLSRYVERSQDEFYVNKRNDFDSAHSRTSAEHWPTMCA